MLETITKFLASTSIIDLMYIIITTLSLISCYKKGFILSILSMAKWLLAYVITLILFPRAKPYVRDIIDNEKQTITWNLRVVNDGEIISDDNITISTSIVKHEFVSIEEFKLNPVQESIYSLATLIGCFFLLLFVPLTIYFSALYKSKNDDKLRLEN